jgi:hypothetical protein
MTTTTEPMLDYVLRHLEASKGHHAEIAAATGVPYFTLKNIAQRKAKDPRASSLQPLHDYFRAQEGVNNSKH